MEGIPRGIEPELGDPLSGVTGLVVDPADLLADVSRALATEAEPGAALELVLRRLVPAVADWGVVRLREPDGSVRRVAAVHGDPAKAPMVQGLIGTKPFEVAPEHQLGALFSGNRVQLYDDLDPASFDMIEADPAARVAWAELGTASVAVAPLSAGGLTLGAFVLVQSDHGRRFDPAHVRVVESLAAQCALLVINTRLVREVEATSRERSSVRTLLDSVLANAPVATAILDDAQRVVHANEAFASIAEGRLGSALADAIPDLAAGVVPLVEEALSAGVAVDRAVVRARATADGERHHWQVSAFPVDRGDGGRFGVGLFLSDVSGERRVARRLTDSVARLDLSLAAGGLATWDWDLLRNEAGWGGGADEVLALIPDLEDRSPRKFLATVHPDDRDDHRDKLLAAARSASDFQNEVRVLRPDGEVRWIEVRGRVVLAADGTPRRMIGVVADVTDRRLMEEIKVRLLEREHQARVEAEAARERLALVAEAGAALMGTLDTQAALEYIPRLIVPRVCDWCAIDMLDDDGDLHEVVMVHVDPGAIADIRAARVVRRDAGGAPLWSVRRAMRTGSSELVLDISDDDLVAAAVNDEHLALLRRLDPRSAIAVPLVARGQVIGGLTVAVSGDRRFEPDDLTLVENLAGRAAIAVDTSRLFESRSQVARALQQTLLPPALPRIPHVDLVARYRVAADGIDIGGDFYDAFDLGEGAWAVVIGDVCGRGAGAAAVTGLFRHTVRAVSTQETEPAGVLRATNEAILGQIDDTRFCTAVFVRVRPEPGRVRATIACGGHPRPIVVRADGAVERVDVSGTLLGVLPEPSLTEAELDLRAGDAVVLYTDGVTEARHGSDQFGETRLVAALREAMATGANRAASLADRLEAAVDDFRDGNAGDDIAILVLRVEEQA